MTLSNEKNGFSTDPVHSEYELDRGPGIYRIGLLALSNDLATERDFINMRSDDDIAIFVSRVLNDDICSVEKLREMEPELTRATSLIIPGSRLDSIAYSCTSGTVVMGYDTIARRVHEIRPGIPVSTPITAALDALRLFDVHKISVLTPYTDNVNGPIQRYLTEHGLDVVAYTSFQFADNDSMAKLPPDAIFNAARQADRPEAEALFISCTAIRAVDVVDAIEQDLGKPVVTATQALYWQALRSAGYLLPVNGFGTLLRMTANGRFNDNLSEVQEQTREA